MYRFSPVFSRTNRGISRLLGSFVLPMALAVFVLAIPQYAQAVTCDNPGTPDNGMKTAGIPANQAAGACNNAKDAPALLAPGAQAKITDCLIANLFDQPAGLACAKKASGISDGCVVCFGALTKCGATNCLQQCLGGVTPECAACNIKAGCYGAFDKCSGVPIVPVYAVAMTIKYACATNYEIKGAAALTCGKDGKWDAALPSCAKAGCKAGTWSKTGASP